MNYMLAIHNYLIPKGFEQKRLYNDSLCDFHKTYNDKEIIITVSKVKKYMYFTIKCFKLDDYPYYEFPVMANFDGVTEETFLQKMDEVKNQLLDTLDYNIKFNAIQLKTIERHSEIATSTSEAIKEIL